MDVSEAIPALGKALSSDMQSVRVFAAETLEILADRNVNLSKVRDEIIGSISDAQDENVLVSLVKTIAKAFPDVDLKTVMSEDVARKLNRMVEAGGVHRDELPLNVQLRLDEVSSGTQGASFTVSQPPRQPFSGAPRPGNRGRC